ncbi:hypothetical protein C8F04DRAFT_1268068 [Mycena alexandri]|uniref:Uncharacterized protein n=1 Tax=Mycena alexandri TaxID=1745969 RepID=A0AAD6SEY1_9AGAR|nr:hypothetical protein C8F04DRAFT_1268068 [Mycena alexandri]
MAEPKGDPVFPPEILMEVASQCELPELKEMCASGPPIAGCALPVLFRDVRLAAGKIPQVQMFADAVLDRHNRKGRENVSQAVKTLAINGLCPPRSSYHGHEYTIHRIGKALLCLSNLVKLEFTTTSNRLFWDNLVAAGALNQLLSLRIQIFNGWVQGPIRFVTARPKLRVVSLGVDQRTYDERRVKESVPAIVAPNVRWFEGTAAFASNLIDAHELHSITIDWHTEQVPGPTLGALAANAPAVKYLRNRRASFTDGDIIKAAGSAGVNLGSIKFTGEPPFNEDEGNFPPDDSIAKHLRYLPGLRYLGMERVPHRTATAHRQVLQEWTNNGAQLTAVDFGEIEWKWVETGERAGWCRTLRFVFDEAVGLFGMQTAREQDELNAWDAFVRGEVSEEVELDSDDETLFPSDAGTYGGSSQTVVDAAADWWYSEDDDDFFMSTLDDE